jgi:hypothetical protein
VTSGTLPGGLSLNTSTGAITGTPNVEISSTVTITATDANGCPGSRSYTLAMSCPPITVNPASVPAGLVGTAYTSTTFTATGGTAPYQYTVIAGTLPAGLTLTTAGVLSGTPTTSNGAGVSVTVQARDALNCLGTRAYTIKICPVISLAAVSTSATTGIAYSSAATASGGASPYVYALTSGTLPAGLSLNTSTGAITGTPTSTTNQIFTITATDANACSGSRAYTLAPVCPTITVSPTSLANGTIGIAYSQTITASGGTSPYVWTTPSGTWPAGLTLSSAGVLSGTPTTSTGAAVSVTVRATDANGCFKDQLVSIKICPVITLPAISTTITVGTAYSSSAAATGGVSPYTYAVTTGTLPTGLSLNTTTGAITGTPTNATSQTFTITATDANACPGTRSYTLAPLCPAITVNPSTLPAGAVGAAYSQTVSATGGTAPYNFTLTSGTLPAGLTLTAGTGVIAGTPTAGNGAGVSLTFTATDTYGCTGTRTVTLKICPTITLPAISTTLTVGTAYSASTAASGGAAPYVYALTTGTLPTGLNLDVNTGAITGTPTNTTSQTFTVRATDANACTGTRSYTLAPVCPAITVTPTSLTNGTLGLAYSQTLSASGGSTPYTWSTTSGTWPAGLSLSSAGIVSGTPTASNGAGVNVTVRATDVYGCFKDQVVSIKICPVITLGPASLANSTVGLAYSQSITASGSSATPFTYSVSSGTLPAGLTLNTSTGAITGTPTSSAVATFTIRAADANGCSGTQSYTVTPACPIITINPVTLLVGTVGSAYSQALSATGGTAPYGSWTITSGTLPAGLALNVSTGAITGTPTADNGAGTSITVRVTDTYGCTGTRTYTLRICPVITLNPTSLAGMTTGVAYSQTISASGSTATPFTYTVQSGTLPAGLTLNSSSGLISGTPTSTSTSIFTLRATDANGCFGTRAYTITPVCGTITLSPGTMPAAIIGTAYSQTVTASGGVAPYTFAVSVGSLPAGLSLNTTTGAITGTPTSTTASFTIRATDANTCQGSLAYSITPTCPAMTLNPTTLAIGYVGAAFSQTLTTTGGTAAYTYTVTSGTLPAGLALNASTGAITGTPTAASSASITFRTADAYGCNTSRAYTLTIRSLSVGDLVFEDSNDNGLKDASEPGVAGALVQLFNPGSDNAIGGAPADVQVGSNITTTSTGAYSFTNLSAGNFYIKVTPPTDYAETGGTPATTDNNVDNNNDGAQPGGAGTPLFSPIFALAAGTESTTDDDTDADTNTTIDFGLFNTVSVGNLVYFDLNNDGSYDFNEGLEGVLVQIYTQGSTVGVTPAAGVAITDNKGRYLIEGLNPGSYFLHLPASQFGGGMPLEGMIPMSSVVAGDDNAGQDLIAAATPSTTGASTAVFSLRPTLSPSGSSENGFEGITDDGTDTRVDLTRDLGLVSGTGTGFPSASNVVSNMLGAPAPSASTATNSLTASTLTFASWSTQNSLTSATADEDGDNASNLLEYALGTDPRSGLLVTRFALEANQTSQTIDAIVTRPMEGRDDLRFTLEAASQLENADWKALALPAAATFNRDGTVTRRYADLAPANATLGFLRLRVELDANRDGKPEATTTSVTHAWTFQTFANGARTFSMPLVQPALYTGTATITEDGTLTLPQSLKLPTFTELEILDGPHAGRTATVEANKVTTTIPATTARITLRPHHTLEALLPAADLSDEDRLLAYDTAKSTFVPAEVDAPFTAFSGILVKITGSGFTRAYTGEVRSKALRIPLVKGTQLITTGSLTSGEVPTNLSEGDRLRFWQPATSDYSSHTLENGAWTPAAPAVKPFESLFLIRSTSLLWLAAP